MLKYIFQRFSNSLIFTILFLTILGCISWIEIAKQEDPTIVDRYARVIINWPGASPRLIDDQVASPIYDKIRQIKSIDQVHLEIKPNIASFYLWQKDDVSDTDTGWTEVRAALENAKSELPPSVKSINFYSGLADVNSVIISVSGNDDLIFLEKKAEKIRDTLLEIYDLKKVTISGSPKAELLIELDDNIIESYGAYPELVISQIRMNNKMMPSGSLNNGNLKILLDSKPYLSSIEEFKKMEIKMPSAKTMALGSIAEIKLVPRKPILSKTLSNGKPCILIGLIAKEKIDLLELGEELQRKLIELQEQHNDVKLEIVSYQPGFLKDRLTQLSSNLLTGTFFVSIALFMVFGIRVALIVSSAIPIIATITIYIYHSTGGILQQMSIAGIIVALGIFIDNVIVISEAIQKKIDFGLEKITAATETVKELAIPLTISTITTIAGFLPLYLAKGPVAEFIEAIPITVIISLSLSLVYSLLFLPVFCIIFMKPVSSTNKIANSSRSFIIQFFHRITEIAMNYPKTCFSLSFSIVITCLLLSSQIKINFFPEADRPQLIAEIELNKGTRMDKTYQSLLKIESELRKSQYVKSSISSVGGSLPKFYYNSPEFPYQENKAQILIRLKSRNDYDSFRTWFDNMANKSFPYAMISLKILEQGPPVSAPVEVRLLGHDTDKLRQAAKSITLFLKNSKGTRDVKHTLDSGVPSLELIPDESLMGKYLIGRTELTRSILLRTKGLEIGPYYGDKDLKLVRVKTKKTGHYNLNEIGEIPLTYKNKSHIRIDHISDHQLKWQSANLQRYNGYQMVDVTSNLKSGYTYYDISSQIQEALNNNEIQLPEGIHLDLRGVHAEASKATNALLKNLPLCLSILLLSLLIGFNSFKVLLIILLSIPLAITGVIPGLLISNSPFGFMSTLGILSLIGIVVNNAIILIDNIRRKEALYSDQYPDLKSLILSAVKSRIRPVLLTTITTILSIFPLAIGSNTLWPPLANAIIFGLCGSTFFTLILIPVVYNQIYSQYFSLKKGERHA